MPIALSSRVLLIVAALASSSAGAQTVRHPDTVYVGSVKLATGHLRNDSSEYTVLAPDSAAAGGTRVVGRLSMRTIVFEVEHETRYLFRVNHFVGGATEVTDSIMTAAATLAPIWETSHQTSKLMHLRWDGRQVSGDVTPTGKSLERLAQTMAVPPFNSSDGSIVIACLPLAENYRTLLATYEYEAGGLRVDTLSVLGRERVAVGSGSGRDAWKVRVSRGGGSWMTLWLDAGSRELLREEFGSAARGWTIRILRV